jgi:hypothetical protein
MRQLRLPPLAFWRDWLRFSTQVFAQFIVSLCVVWPLIGAVLPWVLPPPPCAMGPLPAAMNDLDEFFPECLPAQHSCAADGVAAGLRK